MRPKRCGQRWFSAGERKIRDRRYLLDPRQLAQNMDRKRLQLADSLRRITSQLLSQHVALYIGIHDGSGSGFGRRLKAVIRVVTRELVGDDGFHSRIISVNTLLILNLS